MNVYELITRCLFLFKAGCIVSAKYLDVPYGAAPIVDTMVLIGYAQVPNCRGGVDILSHDYRIGGVIMN